jgi:hypothetical protein
MGDCVSVVLNIKEVFSAQVEGKLFLDAEILI